MDEHQAPTHARLRKDAVSEVTNHGWRTPIEQGVHHCGQGHQLCVAKEHQRHYAQDQNSHADAAREHFRYKVQISGGSQGKGEKRGTVVIEYHQRDILKHDVDSKLSK